MWRRRNLNNHQDNHQASCADAQAGSVVIEQPWGASLDERVPVGIPVVLNEQQEQQARLDGKIGVTYPVWPVLQRPSVANPVPRPFKRKMAVATVQAQNSVVTPMLALVPSIEENFLRLRVDQCSMETLLDRSMSDRRKKLCREKANAWLVRFTNNQQQVAPYVLTFMKYQERLGVQGAIRAVLCAKFFNYYLVRGQFKAAVHDWCIYAPKMTYLQEAFFGSLVPTMQELFIRLKVRQAFLEEDFHCEDLANNKNYQTILLLVDKAKKEMQKAEHRLAGKSIPKRSRSESLPKRQKSTQSPKAVLPATTAKPIGSSSADVWRSLAKGGGSTADSSSQPVVGSFDAGNNQARAGCGPWDFGV